MKHQILICSYPPDYQWLGPCLASLQKFCRGFLPPVVCVDTPDIVTAGDVTNGTGAFLVSYPLVNGMSGFMRAQCAMMHGDQLCPDADVVWLLGSDCLAFAEMRPEQLMHDGKPVMLYNTFEHLLKYHPQVMPWKVGTERILGFPCPLETMRRLPLLYPKALFPAMRAHVAKQHQRDFTEYIFTENTKHHNTSESNILGSYAHWHMPQIYHWENMDERYGETVAKWPAPVIQFWSHGGLDRPADCRYDYPGGNTYNKTPREIIAEVLAYPAPA